MCLQFSLRALKLVTTAACVELALIRGTTQLIYRTIHCTYTWSQSELGEPFPVPW
jgi:hypothetical protein